MINRSVLGRYLMVLLLIAPLLGCTGKATAPVNGGVKFKDGSNATALASYSLTFEPEDGKTSSVGEVNPDGTFKLSTFGANDGAIPGNTAWLFRPPSIPTRISPPPNRSCPPNTVI